MSDDEIKHRARAMERPEDRAARERDERHADEAMRRAIEPRGMKPTATIDKPSIAELRLLIARGGAIRTFAPLLLEIVAAALAWRDQRVENLHAALMRTETEIEAEAQNVQRARVKRTADLARALEAALAKVTP